MVGERDGSRRGRAGARRAAALMVLAVLAGTAPAGCSAGERDPAVGATPTSAAGPSPDGRSAAAAPSTGALRSVTGGGTAAPGQPLPTGHAPTRTYPVATQALRVTRGPARELAVTVWYPARSAGPSAAAADGRFPVILFSHGLGGLPTDYTSLLRRWASAGFVVVGPAYPHTRRGPGGIDVVDVLEQPADASVVLTRVLTPGVLRARVDPARVGAAGHSAGGITTVGLFTSARDARLVAGVVLAGSSLGVGAGFTGPPAWLLFVHGTADPLVTYEAGRQAYAADPWPKGFLGLPGQGHGAPFLDPAAPAFGVVAAVTTDFWRLALDGDQAAGDRLRADARSRGAAVPTTLAGTLLGGG